jgi:NitT/TauT family transport system permease protein
VKTTVKILVGFVVVIALWWMLAETEWAKTSPRIAWLAHPIPVAVALTKILTSQLRHIGATMVRVIEATVLVLSTGILCGVLLGYLSLVYPFFEGVLDFWRSIPPIVVLPVLFFIQPEGDWARIALVFFGCVPILLMQIAESVRSIPSERRDFAQQIGASVIFKVRRILWYELLPHLFISVRTVVSFAVIIIVVSEMVRGAGSGIGDQINSYMFSDVGTPFVYAYAIITGFLGFFFNLLVRWTENRVVNWRN